MGRSNLITLLFQNMDNLSVLNAVSNLLIAFLCVIIIYAVYFLRYFGISKHTILRNILRRNLFPFSCSR